MKKVLAVALNGLLRTARDKKALVLLLLMPMMLIGILGASLKSMWEGNNMEPFDVLLVNTDQPAKPALPPGAPPAAAAQLPTLHLGQTFADEVLTSDQLKNLLNVTTATDLEEAKQMVADDKAVALLYLPPAFSADVLSGKPTEVQVFADPGKPTQADIVTQIARMFTDAVNTESLQARHLGATAQPIDPAKLVTFRDTPTGTREVSALQYYAAAMALMFMTMTAFGQAKDLILERQEGTLARTLISPTSKATIIAGQMLGTFLIILAQFVILLIGTRLLFGVYWGGWLPALLLGGAFALAAAGIGMATTAVLDDPKAADAAVGVVSNLFAALSGAMFPLYIFPDGLRRVAHAVPNYWGLQGFLDQMSGFGYDHLWLPVAILVATGIVTGGFGAWRVSSK